MTGMMHSSRRRPTCCKCHVCDCKCHRKLTKKEREQINKESIRLLGVAAFLILLLSGSCIYQNKHPSPIPQICLQTEDKPHYEKHYFVTGGEYQRLEFKCLKSVPDPNY